MEADRNANEGVILSDGRKAAFQAEVAKQLPQLAEEERQELALALQRVAEALRPARIYVFGSYARGTAVQGVSDVDLLVVVGDSSEPSYRRAQRAYSAVGAHDLPLDILVLTQAEFDGRSSAWSVQAEVQRDGRLLYAA
jgi:predicted nucleotidyltransferase